MPLTTRRADKAALSDKVLAITAEKDISELPEFRGHLTILSLSSYPIGQNGNGGMREVECCQRIEKLAGRLDGLRT